MDGGAKNPNWIRAIDVETLERRGRAILRHEGRQIALFATPEGVRACNNRCPHEGYPLSEGTLGKGAESGCVLTCNWHNWKFDLATGANLDRGEALRVYPVKLEQGAVWLDLTDPPVEARRARVLASLRSAFDDEDYERMARELARLSALGDPLDALRAAISWSWERLEYGWTHAYAAMACWIRLRAERAARYEAGPRHLARKPGAAGGELPAAGRPIPSPRLSGPGARRISSPPSRPRMRTAPSPACAAPLPRACISPISSAPSRGQPSPITPISAIP